jgi:ATP-binding cassette subfamily B protein/subfamily B ATP-binding cassette protein MsbA
VWPHWRQLLLVLFTMAGAVAFDVLRPWPMKLLVDQVLAGNPMPPGVRSVLPLLPGALHPEGLLLWVCASTVLIFAAATLLSMVNTVWSVALGQRMTYDLGADLFRHLQRLSLLFHSRRHVGDMSARVTGDAYCVQVMVTGAILPLLQSLVSLVAMFAIMWGLQPRLTLLSLAVAPFLGATIRLFRDPMKDRGRYRRDLEGKMASLVQQTLSGIPAIQAFTREEFEQARFQRYADETVEAYRSTTSSQMWFKLLGGLVTAVGTAAIMWLGAHLVLDGRMTVGSMLVFLSYLSSLYAPLNSITYTASTMQYAAANADRVMEILTTAPDVEEAPDAKDAVLRGRVSYEHVTFGYEPGRPVLQDVSIEFNTGEVIAIVGPTGAGKTTLVNLLIRFFDPWSGRVAIDGHDLRTLRIQPLRRQVAMVLQDPFIFPMTVAENIAYATPGASRAQIEAAAVAANADEFIRRLPEGYDTIVGERGATLSGGEKQRLSIARAFLKDAPLLVLDEPTSALDARTEGLLLDALGRLMKGRTTVIIAHRFSTIRNADRIVVLNRGRIVEQGTHDTLLKANGLYAELYVQQVEVLRHDALELAPATGTGKVG